MNKKQENLMLEELINTSVNYIQGKATQGEIDKLGERMKIRGYIPILEKMRLIMSVVFYLNSQSVEMEEIRVVNMQKVLFFDVLLGAYAQVDVSNESLKTYDAYDLLYPIFAQYILQYCEFDYNGLIKMIDKSLDIYSMKDLDRMFRSVDYQSLKKAHEDNEKLLRDLQTSKELLENLRESYEITHPALKKTYDAIGEVAVKELKNLEGQN